MNKRENKNKCDFLVEKKYRDAEAVIRKIRKEFTADNLTGRQKDLKCYYDKAQIHFKRGCCQMPDRKKINKKISTLPFEKVQNSTPIQQEAMKNPKITKLDDQVSMEIQMDNNDTLSPILLEENQTSTPHRRQSLNSYRTIPRARSIFSQFLMGSLENTNNTCYINSVLFALRFTPTFVHNIHHLKQHLFVLTNMKAPITSTYAKNVCILQQVTEVLASRSDQLPNFQSKINQNIIFELHHVLEKLTEMELDGDAGSPISTHRLQEAVLETYKTFVPGTQQDAHEFLITILDCIRECCDDCMNWASGISSETMGIFGFDYFDKHFLGNQVVTKICSDCNFEYEISEDMICLIIKIPLDKMIDGESIQESCFTIEIDEFSQCNHCHRNTNKQNIITYPKLPLILVMQLCVFDNNMDKIFIDTQIPFELNCFCENCMASIDDGGNVLHKYNLFGIIIHVGGAITSGHYVAYVRQLKENHPKEFQCLSQTCCEIKIMPTESNLTNDNEWYICDDDTITPISQTRLIEKLKDDAFYKTPYVLFYARNDILDDTYT